MLELTLPAGDDVARVWFTERDDGDFAVGGDPDQLGLDRRAVTGTDWTWLDQVHGTATVEVDAPGGGAGTRADAAFTRCEGAVLSITSADCAAVAITGAGMVAVAHAGWRGLAEGILQTLVDQLDADPASLRAAVGPCIKAADYPFGEDDLAQLVQRYGDGARSATRAGDASLDLGHCVRSGLSRAGVDRVIDLDLDTADAARWFSHRLRGDLGRHAMAVVLEHR